MSEDILLRQTLGEVRASRPLRYAIWAALILIFVSIALQIPLIVQRFISPYVITSASLLSQDIHPGDSLLVSYSIIRRRVCRVDIDRWIVEAPEGVLLYKDRTPGGGHELGSQRRIVNSLRVPEDAKPGEYILHTTVVNECADGLHTTDAPSLLFRITSKPG